VGLRHTTGCLSSINLHTHQPDSQHHGFGSYLYPSHSSVAKPPDLNAALHLHVAWGWATKRNEKSDITSQDVIYNYFEKCIYSTIYVCRKATTQPASTIEQTQTS